MLVPLLNLKASVPALMVIKGSLDKGFCFAAAADDDDDGAFLFSELNTNKRFCLHPVRTQFT